MAYKDEYEVARLYTDGSFRRQLDGEFEGWTALEFHLAPPLLAARDPATGQPRKRRYGPWMMRRSACWRGSRACAAPRSTRSATPPSAGPSGG